MKQSQFFYISGLLSLIASLQASQTDAPEAVPSSLLGLAALHIILAVVSALRND